MLSQGIDLRVGNLAYSGCAFFIGGFSYNLINRGQNDNGSCTSMCWESCVDALIHQAANTAFGLTENYTEQNLTAGSLPAVCSGIEAGMTAVGAVPGACAEFVSDSMTWSYGTLPREDVSFVYSSITGPGSNVDDTCSINTTSSNLSYPQAPNSTLYLLGHSGMDSQNYSASLVEEIYNNATSWTYPIITVLFPPANSSNRNGALGVKTVVTAEAFMTCPRTVNFTEGSTFPPALPSPTPLRKLPMSKGKKTGIIVGVVLGTVLIVVIVGW